MIIRKSNLEVFLQDINKKVIKIKSKLELYKDMKKFLLLVKFKVTKLSDIPNKYVQYYGLSECAIRRRSTLSEDAILPMSNKAQKLSLTLARRKTKIFIQKSTITRSLVKKSTIAKNVLDEIKNLMKRM